MAENISVEEALKKGNRMLKIPTLLLFIVMLASGLAIAAIKGFHPAIGLISGFVAGAGLAVLYSGYMTTKWRIWAFTNVDDVHELKRAAITEQLINEDNSWQNKLEIRFASDRPKLAEVQKRFDEERGFTDDPSVADETLIYNSNIEWKVAGWIVIVAGIFVAMVWSLFGLLGLVAGGTMLLWNNKVQENSQNKLPVITISNSGIQTNAAGFNKWASISNELIAYRTSGRNGCYELTYDYPGGSESININYLKINPGELNHLLYIYHNRDKQNQPVQDVKE